MIQRPLPFSPTRSGVYQVEADGLPKEVGRDCAGDPAVEEVEAAASRSGDDLVDEVCAVLDSLRVVLDRGLVDGARCWSGSGELSAWGVVEQEIAA